jgi:uncharacterized protein DUF6220
MNTLQDLEHSVDEPIITILTPAEMKRLTHSGGRSLRAHRIIARVLLVGLAVQLFFAGLGVFGVYGFLPHAIMGASIIAASFSLPILAWRGHLERARLRRSWLLAGLMILQGLLIDLGRIWPIVAAFHPVNAMLLVLLTFSLI